MVLKSLVLAFDLDNRDPCLDSNTLILSPINKPDGPLRVLGSGLGSIAGVGVVIDNTRDGNTDGSQLPSTLVAGWYT